MAGKFSGVLVLVLLKGLVIAQISGADTGGTTMKDWCSMQGCEHGGTCTNTVYGALCHCPPRYVGEHCETLNPSFTGPPNAAATTSTPQAGGTTMKDWCSLQGCEHGGTCTNTVYGALCHCPPRYVGEHCETLNPSFTGPPNAAATTSTPQAGGTTMKDWCSLQGCDHGGTCTNTVHGALCHCPPRYVGEHCETLNPSFTGVAALTSTPSAVASTASVQRLNTSTSARALTAAPTRTTISGTRVTSLLNVTTAKFNVSTRRTEGESSSSGCSVLLCYIVIPLVSILSLALLALLVLLIYCKAVKKRQEAQVSPRSSLVQVSPAPKDTRAIAPLDF